MPLTLLLRLLHEKFPATLTADPDIRNASVLLATGLIEAEFHLDHFGYQQCESAVVFAITDAGHAEIANLQTGNVATAAEGPGVARHATRLPAQDREFDLPPAHRRSSRDQLGGRVECGGHGGSHASPTCRARQTQQKFKQAVVLRVTPLGRTALVARRM